IMHRLLAGEKLTYEGSYYQTNSAKLYSPPLHQVPIYIAAGGQQTAALAGQIADGIIVSVKSASDTLSEIIAPASQQAGQKKFDLVASHWSVYAKDSQEAWQALQPWRGLRAPSRDRATNPVVLQKEADSLPRDQVLASYNILGSADDFVKAYQPLVKGLGADIIGFQTTAIDQAALIRMVGKDVLPRLKMLK
ncbi:MAG: LLM class flavin-dependent oxidoreductase, partial [Candidatus Saccharimonadales bacterium]